MQTEALNQKLAKTEEELTVILDSLDLLLQEKAALEQKWQGMARTQWCCLCEQKVEEISTSIKKLKDLVALFRSAAQSLANAERRLYGRIGVE